MGHQDTKIYTFQLFGNTEARQVWPPTWTTAAAATSLQMAGSRDGAPEHSLATSRSWSPARSQSWPPRGSRVLSGLQSGFPPRSPSHGTHRPHLHPSRARAGLCPTDCPMASIEPGDMCAPKQSATKSCAGRECGSYGAGGIFGIQPSPARSMRDQQRTEHERQRDRGDEKSLWSQQLPLDRGPRLCLRVRGHNRWLRTSCFQQMDKHHYWTQLKKSRFPKSFGLQPRGDKAPVWEQAPAAIAASSGHRALCLTLKGWRLHTSTVGRPPPCPPTRGERSEAPPCGPARSLWPPASLGLPQHSSTALTNR